MSSLRAMDVFLFGLVNQTLASAAREVLWLMFSCLFGPARILLAQRLFAAATVRRVRALVERDHPAVMAIWTAMGYALDGRIVRFIKQAGSS